MIKQCDNKWCLYTKDGLKLLGKHATKEQAEEQERAIEENKNFTISDREIFSTGKHNGDDYTDEDLENMVSAFNSLDYKPALKLGHSKEVGAPAYGYVDNVKKVGSKLIADLVDLPKQIYDAILSKRYGRVSAEVFFNLTRAGKNYKRAIAAVALLGQEIPAVAGLKPLYEYENNSDEFESLKIYEFDIIKQDSATGGSSTTGDGDLKKGNPEMDEKLKEYELKFAEMQTQLKALASKADAGTDDAKKYAQEVEQLKGKLRDKESEEKAAALLIPALRPQVKALYEFGMANAETSLKVYSEKGESVDKPICVVVDEVVNFINSKAKDLFKEFAVGGEERQEGYDDPSVEVDARVKKHMASTNTNDYAAAQRAVLNADQALKLAYLSI